MAKQKTNHQSNGRDLRMRQQLAQEAARLIVEEGIQDFHSAKHKAAERLHAPQTHNLPRNDEIQLALTQYLRIFKADTQPQQLRQLRQISHRVMEIFKQFEPRLAGAVLDGTATEFSEITLHLFADSSEELTVFLLNARIPFEQSSQQLTMPNGELIEVPVFRLEIEARCVRLLIFNHKGLRQAPLCPTTGKPMQRFSISKVEELIRLSSI